MKFNNSSIEIDEVANFIVYLRKLILNKEVDGEINPFPFHFNKNKDSYNSFMDAAYRYNWNRTTFLNTKIILDGLRFNTENENNYDMLLKTLKLYKWGGVERNIGKLIEQFNSRSISQCVNDLPTAYEKGGNEKIEALLERRVNLFGDEGELYRLDSGLTKFYSLFVPGFIIYDGRVGSAWCYLYRCFKNNDANVDYSAIPFAWGSSAESDRKKGEWTKKTPSKYLNDNSKYFRILAKSKNKKRNSKIHAECNVIANYIIEELFSDEETIDAYSKRFMCCNEYKCLIDSMNNKQKLYFLMNLFEAALFMMGYDLSMAVDRFS